MFFQRDKATKRWRPRWSLATLLIVMTALCVWLGWKTEQARKQRNAVAWIQEHGGQVTYDYEVNSDGSVIQNAAPQSPDWIRERLGVDYFHDVVSVHLGGKEWIEDVSPLSGCPSLRRLHLNHTGVSDVTPLARLSSLEYVTLSETNVSDLQPLSGLTELKALNLYGTKVRDASPLAGLVNLERLSLGETAVSDVTPLAGLKSLRHLSLSGIPASDLSAIAGLKNLEILLLRDKKVDKSTVEQLSEALPNCRIDF